VEKRERFHMTELVKIFKILNEAKKISSELSHALSDVEEAFFVTKKTGLRNESKPGANFSLI
jgi:hypothetical protein